MRDENRVRSLGEVFTPEVTAREMLSLIEESNYASRFLEPGCGNGNFLILILGEKLKLVENLSEVKQSLKSQEVDQVELKSLISLASIYGVDIDLENVNESRNRLRDAYTKWYEKLTKLKISNELMRGVEAILQSNIILGDLINLDPDLVVVEYSELPFQKIQRRVFRFQDLIYPVDETFEDNEMLFGHIPLALQTYPPIPFREITCI
jgi:hypothetical protein